MIVAMVRALPTGVVTLLFTDVEGSTRLLYELADDYGEALHEHRRRLRAVFVDHEGVEVDTQGDAFFVAFARASNAVAAATDGQLALANGPIRVRMGLHTGEPRLTEEGYVGLDVHKGARIAAVGHGGQVLLSQTTRVLVDADVRDLGVHRLKDLSAPERIYQLEIDGLPGEFPLLNTLEAGMKNLPLPRTSFVGRESELEAIDRLLEDPGCRLLTLVGPGGAGKTRLALEAAARRVDRYPHGVHFVPLVSVASPDFLAPALAESIQFAVDGAHSSLSAQEQLLDYLSERSTLLVLDNFEHLVEGSGLLNEVIERTPHVELLTTSRERLNLQSEWVVDVDGLGLAGNGNGSASAVRLFVERATQVVPDFALDDAGYSQALRICRLVDGMPLGIELAASWASVLSCAEIADEIERSIDFLATSMRDVPERHRSLRAAIDQSWRLLTDEQRRAFSRLSVFRGSFDRGAAVAVTGADLRLLSELVAKSLLRRPDFGRFELHELLRQYAAEQLRLSRAEEAYARERHARHYTAMLLERQAALMGPELAVARDELRGELDNLRAAAEWTLVEEDEHPALEVLEAFYVFLWMHSWFDGAETLERLARTAGFDADDPGSASAVARPRCTVSRSAPGSGMTRHRRSSPGAACPSCGRGTWSERSQAACARWASWRCIGTCTRRRWRSPKRVRRSRERSATGSPRAAVGWISVSPNSSWTTSKRRARRSRMRTSSQRSWATRFCARMPRASSAFSPMPRSATATRFACTWRLSTCSRRSVRSAEPATR
jgi:predicted ATPase/class 3 adenylate cyclase